MVYYLLTCRSLTYAQKTARTLERAGISAIIIKTPQKISTDGCSYCVRISEKKLSDALIALRRMELYPVRVFVQSSNGKFGEVHV